jgi:hypothetical protein
MPSPPPFADSSTALCRVQGFDEVAVSQQPMDTAALFSSEAGSEEVAVVRVQLGQHVGEVTLAANATRVSSDSHVVRRLLGDAVLSKLHVL